MLECLVRFCEVSKVAKSQRAHSKQRSFLQAVSYRNLETDFLTVTQLKI